MFSVNYIQLVFAFLASSIIALGSLINTFEKYLPAFFIEIFRYGKFAYKGKSSFIRPVQVPKSWFRHFYIFSTFLAFITLTLVIRAYVFGIHPPLWARSLLDIVCGEARTASTDAASVLLVVCLLTIQCTRRLYDTHCVSVFGKNSRMDLSHYIIGFIHYAGAFLAILCEAPMFASNELQATTSTQESVAKLLASSLFLWACYHQYRVNVILGNLRRDKNGNVVTSAHKLPKGDWFEYVSSPHLIAEILMYFSLTVIIWRNLTWWFIFGWVLCNQVETALLSHWWYQETFKDFPDNRRALIPFIY